MKLIAPFLAAAFFAAMALAQEESAAPATEEKASATVEETPAAEPVVTPEKARSPGVAERSARPAEAKKATSDAASKAASPAVAIPAKKMSVEVALKDNENRWEAAYAAHDASVVQSLVANDFVGVYTDGKVTGKSGVISELTKSKETYKSAVNEKLEVHTYGPSVAVVVGTARETGTTKDGKPFDRTFRFTDTWMERNGQWQCVASQVMRLKG